MAVVLNPDSDLAKELARWEKPYRFEPFPQMLYKAFARENGRVECGDPLEAIGDVAALAFAQKCRLIVHSETECRRALAQGWAETPTQALEVYEQAQRDIATAAAEVHAQVTKMSAKAQAEHKKRDDATHKHLPEG